MIARDLARLMDGDLVVESTKGVGSSFVLSFPAIVPVIPVPPMPSSSTANSEGNYSNGFAFAGGESKNQEGSGYTVAEIRGFGEEGVRNSARFPVSTTLGAPRENEEDEELLVLRARSLPSPRSSADEVCVCVCVCRSVFLTLSSFNDRVWM